MSVVLVFGSGCGVVFGCGMGFGRVEGFVIESLLQMCPWNPSFLSKIALRGAGGGVWGNALRVCFLPFLSSTLLESAIFLSTRDSLAVVRCLVLASLLTFSAESGVFFSLFNFFLEYTFPPYMWFSSGGRFEIYRYI